MKLNLSAGGMAMAHEFRKLTDYLRSHGTDHVPHSQVPFLAHLIGVYRDLQEWGCAEHVVLAGLFHSIYGTESFQGFALPLSHRPEIRALIGERAEHLAYVNCMLSRSSLDSSVAEGGPPRVVSRTDGTPLALTEDEFTDLITLHLCDRLEQVHRTDSWDWRRTAWENMARRLGGIALERWHRVYDNAPPPQGPEYEYVAPVGARNLSASQP